MRLTALHVHDETDATGIVFVRRIVQTTPALLFLVQVRSPIIIYLVVPGHCSGGNRKSGGQRAEKYTGEGVPLQWKPLAFGVKARLHIAKSGRRERSKT